MMDLTLLILIIVVVVVAAVAAAIVMYIVPEWIKAIKQYTGGASIRDIRHVKYYCEPSTVDADFAEICDRVLREDPQLRKYHLTRVANPKHADIHATLLPREQMPLATETHEDSTPIWFSYTYFTEYPRKILFDGGNWLTGARSGLSRDDYHRYVVKHEFMHALGFDHQPCDSTTAYGDRCPIMYQATRGPPAGFLSGTEILDVDFSRTL